MKHALSFLLLLAFFPAYVFAQVTRLAPALTEVTVYFNGAELRHEGELNLPAGLTEVRLQGISAYIEPKSLQAEVDNNAELLSAKLVQAPAAKGTVVLTDSLSLLEKEHRTLNAELFALREEQNFLNANRQLPAGTQTGWSSELQKGADFVRSRQKEINLRLSELEPRQAALWQRVQIMRQQTGGKRLNPAEVQEVALRVRLARPGAVRLQLSYLTYGSQWEPRLVFRVPEVSRDTKLQALNEAVVYNNSDLNWENVRLTLKTANPWVSATRPDLQPWTLQYSGGGLNEGRLDDYAVKGSGHARSTGSTEVSVAELSSRFDVPGRISISRNSDLQTRLSAQELPVRLEYLAIPKLDQDVFLVARITGWEQLNIVSEKATVYYRGAYIGETEIATRAYNDTLEVSLGRDKQVIVSRTKREDLNSKNAIGGARKTRLAYEINVKNTHAVPVRIKVLDQIPVPQEKEIEVKDVETGGAAVDATSGKLTWMLTLQPNESRKLPFGFSIEYPKNKHVNLNRSRNVRAPKYR